VRVGASQRRLARVLADGALHDERREHGLQRAPRMGGSVALIFIAATATHLPASEQDPARPACRLGFPQPAAHPMSDDAILAALREATTATLTTLLLKHGLRNTWLRGAVPLRAGAPRVVGRAFTLRFVPAREDLATPESWSSPVSTRAAIEAMPKDCIAVVDAMGVTDAGIFGDILCARMARRGVAALVTDGVVRDVAGVMATGLPIWCRGTAAPPSVAGLTFVGWQQPVACGGVAVFPDDWIVADGDGAVVVPAALAEAIAQAAPEQERLEAWIMSQVEAGASLPGLYPPNAEQRARYEAQRGRE
jgi:regulator of RNase E activity RraA